MSKKSLQPVSIKAAITSIVYIRFISVIPLIVLGIQRSERYIQAETEQSRRQVAVLVVDIIHQAVATDLRVNAGV